MSRIYWDSMLFIYWLEDHPQFAAKVDAVHARMEIRNDRLITGAFTFGEVLTGAYRKGMAHLAEESRRMMQSVVDEIVPFTVETADQYAQIRSMPGITLADAIHLASAAQANSDLFLTNDRRLVGKIIPGIQFIAPLDSQIL